MQNETEQGIQKAIIDYLRLKKFVAFKHHSTGSTIREGKAVFFKHGDRGIADVIGCSPSGRFIAIEVKKKGGKPSEEQIQFIESVNASGGIGIIAYSLDDVVGKVGDTRASATLH